MSVVTKESNPELYNALFEEDNIKEILRDLEFASGVFDYTITPDRCTFLKDYITNLQEKLEVSQTNEETYRLEMLDITKCLGLDEHTIFDEVKEKATNLQEENQALKHQLDFIGEQNHIIDKLKKENERLKLVRDTKCASEILCECLNNVYKSRNEKAIEFVKEHQRKDGFLNLNEWQTRDLLDILGGDDNE